jgi:hypothetical protein
VEVCCKTVVACVELEVCDFLFSGFILLFSHVDLLFCHCVLLDEAMGSWENFFCVFCFISPLIVSKVGDVCLF